MKSAAGGSGITPRGQDIIRHCRWYPTLLTLPSGNIIIVGGCLVTSGGYAADLQNPTWQIYNVATQGLTYNKPFPTTILTDQVPYSLYPLMWVLPHTGSVLVRCLPHCDQDELRAQTMHVYHLRRPARRLAMHPVRYSPDVEGLRIADCLTQRTKVALP